MKITREKLIKLSENYCRQRAKKDRTILCAILTGSLLREYPFLEGTTDVDILMVHTAISQAYREVMSISDEVTFDIYHYSSECFANPRDLRTNPWVGCALTNDPIVLYGKAHWYEFVLSSVEASFFLPENAMARALSFNRQAHYYYSQLNRFLGTNFECTYIFNYLLCIENAVNSASCLNHRPVTLRHFFPYMTEYCAELPIAGALETETEALITRDPKFRQYFDYYFKNWNYFFDYFANYTRPDFFPEYAKFRLSYYTKAVEGFRESHIASAVWIMLNTWTHINSVMKIETNEPYHSFLKINGLDLANAPARTSQLDAYLEKIDDQIDAWGKEKGLSEGTSIYLDQG